MRGQLLFQPNEDLTLAADCRRVRPGLRLLHAGLPARGHQPARRGAPVSRAFGESAAHGFPAYVPPSTDVFDRLSDIDTDLHIDTQDGGISLNRRLEAGIRGT